MRFLFVAMFGTACAAAMPAAGASDAGLGATPTQCLGPDASSSSTIDYVQFMMTETDTSVAANRAMWALPMASPSNVTLVTDGRVCAKAANALSAHVNSSNPMKGRRVYVVQVATVYVVWDPKLRIGEWEAFYTFDRRFRLLASVAS